MSHRHNIYASFDFEIASATTKWAADVVGGGLDVVDVHRLLAHFQARLLAFRNRMRPGATLSGRTAGASGPAPLSLGDVSPQRNVDPDYQKPGIGTGRSVSLDRGNGRHEAHRTHVECRGLYVLAR